MSTPGGYSNDKGPIMRDIDRVIRQIMAVCPAVKVRQLNVRHPGADDNGVWFFEQPASKFEVQVESTNGTCPFLIETDESNERLTASNVDQTVQILSKLLHL
jgi:hypothetical protein